MITANRYRTIFKTDVWTMIKPNGAKIRLMEGNRYNFFQSIALLLFCLLLAACDLRTAGSGSTDSSGESVDLGLDLSGSNIDKGVKNNPDFGSPKDLAQPIDLWRPDLMPPKCPQANLCLAPPVGHPLDDFKADAGAFGNYQWVITEVWGCGRNLSVNALRNDGKHTIASIFLDVSTGFTGQLSVTVSDPQTGVSRQEFNMGDQGYKGAVQIYLIEPMRDARQGGNLPNNLITLLAEAINCLGTL